MFFLEILLPFLTEVECLLINCCRICNISFMCLSVSIFAQDSYGDTALHDAIGKDSIEIVESLTNWPRLNLTRCNNRGFNVLHHAALKGNN